MSLRDQGYAVITTEVLDDDEPPYASGYIARVSAQLRSSAPDTALILVGHSGAGPLLPQVGLARQAAGSPVLGYVFLDAMLPRALGVASRLALLRAEDAEFAAGLSEALRAGKRFPDWTAADLAAEIPDVGHRALLLAGLRPRGLDFFEEPLPIPEDWPDAPCGFLQLSPTYDVAAATAGRRGWLVHHAELHHFAALTHPQQVADLLNHLISQL